MSLGRRRVIETSSRGKRRKVPETSRRRRVPEMSRGRRRVIETSRWRRRRVPETLFLSFCFLCLEKNKRTTWT